MKTTSFGVINVRQEGGEIVLEVFSPLGGTVTLTLSPDELLLFLVEVANGLYEGRIGEIQKLIEYNIDKEKRR